MEPSSLVVQTRYIKRCYGLQKRIYGPRSVPIKSGVLRKTLTHPGLVTIGGTRQLLGVPLLWLVKGMIQRAFEEQFRARASRSF